MDNRPDDLGPAASGALIAEPAAGRHWLTRVLTALMRGARWTPGASTAMKVKASDEVHPGDILGHLGNSGNSTEPHLHAHIVDRPSFLAGQGVPYEFEHFEATGATQYVAKPHDRMFFKGIGELKPFTDDYPAENAAVSFP